MIDPTHLTTYVNWSTESCGSFDRNLIQCRKERSFVKKHLYPAPIKCNIVDRVVSYYIQKSKRHIDLKATPKDYRIA